jgi:hypothetical protein
MVDKADFNIVGGIVRKYVAPSGKAAFLTVETAVDGRRMKHEMVAFDATTIRQIETAGIGEFVSCKGRLGNKKVTNKNREPAQFDGRDLWVPQYILTYIESASGNVNERPPASAPIPRNSKPVDDSDDIPF